MYPEKLEKLLTTAQSFIGVKEGSQKHKDIINTYNAHKPLARGYAIKTTDDWCSTFVSAMAIVCKLTDIIPTEVSCERHVELFKKLGIWIEDETQLPKVGDILLFNWQPVGSTNSGWSDHIGIVDSVIGNVVRTIEGNYYNAVGHRTFNRSWNCIRGFARPNYGSEVDADDQDDLAEVADQVIRGVWGNAPGRENALMAAGYDYDLVMAEVNALLAKPTVKDLTSFTEIAKKIIQGHYGNGAARVATLTKLGYSATDLSEIQKIVNELLK